MSTIAWRGWEILAGPTAPKFVAREVAILLILAASLLVFRTFRERCLIAWIVGWLAYLGSQHALLSAHANIYSVPLGHAEFAFAVTMFAVGVFIYSGNREFLVPVLAIGGAITLFAAAAEIYWPGSVVLRFALELSYRLVALAAAVQVLRFRRARREVGSWFVAFGLVLLHLDWAPVSSHLPAEAGILLDVLLGLGMLLVVFDEFRIRTRRLATLNALTTNIARAAERGPAAPDALKDLQRLMDSDAIWFRLRNGRQLTIFQHCGLSEEFLRARNSVSTNDSVEAVLEENRPKVIATSKIDAITSAVLQNEHLKQLVIAPVPGKKGLAGNLVLANRRSKSYAPDEFSFLMSCGQQLGLALENLHFVEEILRSHRQWSNTFESIQDLVLLHDSDFHILKANSALLRRLEKSQAEVVGQRCDEVLPKDEIQWKNCPYCHGEENGFFEGPDPFGGFSVASTSTYTDQGTKQKGTIHVVRDITERRAAEQKYRSLFEQLQEGAFVTTISGKLLECNDAFVHMLGYGSRDELLGRNVDSEFYASPEQRSSLRREIEGNNFVRNFEVNLKRKDGTLLTALESSFATRDADGKVDGYQGFLLDITEKKNAEDEIRRRNRELNALNAMAVIATQSFDLDEILNLTLRQVISVLSAEHGSVYLAESPNQFRRRANWGQRVSDRKKLMEANFPEGLGDLVMRSRAEVLTAEYLPHLPKPVSDFVHSNDPGPSIWVVLWGKDAPLGLMGISRGQNQGYTTDDENLLVAIGRQLSTTVEKVRLYEETCKAYDDLRCAQEQLLQSEKMSAIGQLIAGVAHELNNPLTAILGYAQLLETEALESRPLEYASKIFKQAQRTHRVVQNLLSFARQRKPEKQEFDVVKVLEEALLLRDYDMKVGTIKLEREIAEGVPAVCGDPHQFEQVFLNIINNAVDAMMEEKKDGERKLKVRVRSESSSVIIEIQDSGPGIKEPHRIFEPFYTTKSVGKGTGLGLSICYGIVKEHGGEISARNAEGGGAIVEMKLPSAGHASPEVHSAPAIQKRESALAGRVLVVEDEESVLEFERDVLGGTGAQVVTAYNIEQMKAALGTQSFDILIINGKMPGSGNVPETCRWIRDSWPGLSHHFLLTFSSLTETDVRSFLEQNKIPFLVKPFEVGDLIATVRKLLVKAQAAAAQ
ncbi:MAG TPA: PAS domain S-box protein [Terriglobales bacterium]|nr:PAS domain S-box protein [Terriglobales bacterium]